jgi:hypothetical protein
MKEEIHQLARLQRVETEMRTIQNRLEGVDRRIERLEADAGAADAAAGERAEALEALRKRYRDMEGEVRMNEDAVSKKKARLNTLKTNKEYQAMLREIEELEKTNRRLDDEMLKMLEEIETGEAALTKARDEAERVRNEAAAAAAQIREAARQDEARVAELTEDHRAIAAEVPEPLLSAFARVRERVAPPAVVPVMGPSCEGCNMNLPPQMRNELKRFDSLKYCPFCHRIVYWKGA